MDDRAGSGTRRETLATEIARVETESREVAARLRVLQAELAALDSRQEIARETNGALAPEDKIALFRGLFRGRADVFPKLWVNRRKGKKGYAPACSNEWVRGVCEKPRVKCGECPHQAFVAVTDRVALDHLQGRHVMGVYPLLDDETCWFLAADFDGTLWTEDVTALLETCRIHDVPAAVERSRSGKGAHVWFFFKEPVAAGVAREMGCFLLTETMARRHELGMKSYDRLFPNQDTMPRGGFGNLIALPLQHLARQAGNTVFLDERLEPHADQWAYLASVPRMDPGTVERLAKEAVRQGKVLGVGLAEVDEGPETHAPWTVPPSGASGSDRVPGPLPASVHAVQAQRLFVAKAGVPSALLDRIKRLAAFQNPEFYKKQNMRLSTATTPRIIACAEELPEYVALPRGCRDALDRLLSEHEIEFLLIDRQYDGEAADFRFHGKLTSDQERAAQVLLHHDAGVFVAPPGSGKTVVAAKLVADRASNTLVLVHRKPLMDQWIVQLSRFLGIDSKAIGRVGGGKRRPNGHLDVAMIQSVVRKGRVNDLVAGYGHVIIDECHHVPAVSFERVVAAIPARFVLGLTATPYRRDGHHPIVHMQIGPVRHTLTRKTCSAATAPARRLVVRETGFRLRGDATESGIQEVYRTLAGDAGRNDLIVNDVICALDEGRSPILLTERKDHLALLATRLEPFARHLLVLHGGMTRPVMREATAKLESIPDEEERLILATGRYIGEGFDDARLDTLFLAMPFSWKGTLVQYAGRLHRPHPKKIEVRIVDYVDREVPMFRRMFEKRQRAYRAIGYSPGDLSAGHVAGPHELLLLREHDA